MVEKKKRSRETKRKIEKENELKIIENEEDNNKK